MKMGDENTLFQRLGRLLGGHAGLKVGAVSTSALVICGVIATASAMKTQENAVPVDVLPADALVVEVKLPEPADETVEPEDTAEPVDTAAPAKDEITIAPAGASVKSLSEEATSSTTTTQTQNTTTISVDFSKIRSYNTDVKAQIYLPGTKLNYWVAQGTDNSFYLNHSVYKQSFAWGTPMIDYRTTLTKDARSTNVVIYGHSNDKTGEHFSAIKNYKNTQAGIDFYKQHPTIQFNTMYGDGNYKVFAMFLENVNVPGKSFGYHNFINAKSQEDFDAFVREAKGRSFLTMPVDVQYGDQLITLSTCLSTSSKNSRYVLVARKVRPGESSAVEVDKVAINNNMIPASGPLN